MQEHHLTFTVKKPFGNLFRKRCVLIAVQNDEGKILIGAKPHFYPPAISRLLGGGVNEGESFEQAAVRELQEELSITIKADGLIPIALFVTDAKDQESNEYHNKTAVFSVNIGGQTYEAGDDIKHVIPMTPDEVHELGELYEQLPEVLWFNGDEGEYSWADYAKLYGPIHKVTAKKVKAAQH